MAAAPNYSRSEWASLPIQDRIKAMNQATGDDDVESLQQPESLEEKEEPEQPPQPKRTSVVDIWRKQKATPPESAKPKKPIEAKIVSVPWPDEEEKNKPTEVEVAPPAPQKRLSLFGNLFRSRSVSKEESKEADLSKESDLTILPAKSKDDDAEVAGASDAKSVASHSKSVIDAWTKKALVLPDSPITVPQERAPLDAEIPLKRTSVVDLWSKRTIPTSATMSAPKLASNEKAFTSPKSAPLKHVVEEEETDKAAAQDKKREIPSQLPCWGDPLKAKSVVAPPEVKGEEADLTIVPAKSSEEDAQVAATVSHSKSVMDAWTKKALVLPDSPITVPEERVPLDAEMPLKRTSVVDLWSKRTIPTSATISAPKPPPPEKAFTSPKSTPLKRVDEGEKKREIPSQLPSRRDPFKAKSVVAPPEVKSEEVDLTILPAKSSEEDAQVAAAASHSKSVMDAWTKRALAISDAPVTAKVVEPPVADAEIPTKRSSVVDIWSKRTITPAQTSKTTFQRDWKSPPKSAPHTAEDADLDVVHKMEPSSEIKPSSIADRYKSALDEAAPKLRPVPKPLIQVWKSPKTSPHVEEDAGMVVVQQEPSSVVNRYKEATSEASFSTLKLRQVPKTEETAKSSVTDRWQPQGNGTYQQLRKVQTKGSPVVPLSAVEKADDASVIGDEEQRQSPCVTNRWQSSALRKVQRKTSSPVSQPSVENAKDLVAELGAEAPKQSPCVTNRLQPHGNVTTPPLRKVPPKTSPVVSPYGNGAIAPLRKVPPKTSPVVSPFGDGATPPLRKVPPKTSPVVSPYGNGATPPLRKVPPKTSPVVSPYGDGSIPQLRNGSTKTSPVVLPYGNGAIPQLRKVSVTASPQVVPQPSVKQAEEVAGLVTKEPKRSSVSNRWQLLKVPEPVVPLPEAAGETVESKEEPTKISVLDRYKPQASESVQQLRRKVPKPILEAEPEGVDETISDTPKPTSVLDRYKPLVGGTSPAAWRRKSPLKPPDSEQKTEFVEESKPQRNEAIPQLKKAPKSVTNSPSEPTEEPERSSVLEHYKSRTKGSNVLDRYRIQGNGTSPIAQRQKTPTKELSPLRSQAAPNSDRKSTMKELRPVGSQVTPESKDAALSIEKPKSSSVLNRYKPRGNAAAPVRLRRKVAMKNRPPLVTQTLPGPLETTDTAAADIVDEVDEMEEQWALPTINSTGSLPFDESSAANVKKVLASINTIQVAQAGSFERAEKNNLAVVEIPVPVAAVMSRDAPAGNSFMAKGDNDSPRSNGDTPFQSGTSAFRAKGQASELCSRSDKLASQSRPPRSMKEFLKQHQVKGSQHSPDMRERAEKTDDNISTKESSLKGTDPNRIGAVPVSSPTPIENDFQELNEEHEDDNLIAQDDEVTDALLAPVLEDKPIFPVNADTEKVPTADMPIDPTDLDTDAGPAMHVDKPTALMKTDAHTIIELAAERGQPDDEYEVGAVDRSKAMDSPDKPVASTVAMDLPDKPGPTVSRKAMDAPDEQPRGSKLTKSPEEQYNNPSRRIARKKLLLERSTGRKSRGVDDNPSTPSESLSPAVFDQPSRSAHGAIAPRYSTQDLSASPVPSRLLHHKPFNGLTVDTQARRAFPDMQKDEIGSQWSGRYNRTPDSPLKSNSLTPVVSESGTSETSTFFSGASSGYSAAVSAISFGSSVTSQLVISPTSALSNRASQMVIRRRRNKLSKAEEKIAARDLARRVMSQTIKEQPRPGVEEDDSAADHSSEQPPHEEDERFESPKSLESVQSAGLAGRYNTSSRFMDSVHSMLHGVGLGGNTSFESETTEGSSQVRSAESTSAATSDSEAWMSGRGRKSSLSSRHNRVPSDITAGDGRPGLSSTDSNLITDDFVSASATNIEALKSAYKAVSLHQIAMDLTEEVSTATNLNLKKIASDLNDGVSAASESIRSSLGSPSSRSSRKLRVPKSSGVGHAVDEEVAIEVEYVGEEETDGEGNETEDEEIQSIGDLDSEIEGVHASTEKEVEDDDEGFESGFSPDGEPFGSPDRRRAYV